MPEAETTESPTDVGAKTRVPRRFLKEEGKLVDGRLKRLQATFLNGQPRARAQLAELRRGISRTPGDLPEIWSLTDVPSDDLTGTTPTAKEWAVHITMCLYALQQQGRNTPAHVPGRPFGQAIRSLAGNDAEKSPIWRRFTAAMLAQDITGIRDHLQGIVGQMHSAKAYTPFDYAALADDLVALQYPQARSGVRLRWQRDFYSTPATPNDPDTTDNFETITETED